MGAQMPRRSRGGITRLSAPPALALLLLACVAEPAGAQFAVIDVASVAQLVAQAQTLAQQLAVLRMQMAQAQLLYQSMTGSRGLQQLLNTSSLNYLPTNWSQLIAAVGGQG